MRFRKLRIAWAVACGIACVLLIVLWVRSYSWNDVVWRTSPSGLQTSIGSDEGTTYIVHGYLPSTPSEQQTLWGFTSVESSKERLGFQWKSAGRLTFVHVPYWFLVLISAAFAAIPWIRWRFNLRTLLIATTLVAVVLGLIVWQVRR